MLLLKVTVDLLTEIGWYLGETEPAPSELESALGLDYAVLIP